MKKNLLMLLCAVSLMNVTVQADDTASAAQDHNADTPGTATPPAAPGFFGRHWNTAKGNALQEVSRNSFGANAAEYGDIGTKPRWQRPFRAVAHDVTGFGHGVGDYWKTRWNNGMFKEGQDGDRHFSRNSFVPAVATTAARAGIWGGLGYGLHQNAFQRALIKALQLMKIKEDARAMRFAKGRAGKFSANTLAALAALGADYGAAEFGDQSSLLGYGKRGLNAFNRDVSSSWYDEPTDDDEDTV